MAKKLGLKENYKVLLYNVPEHYFDLFSDPPTNLNIISIDKTEEKEIDFIHLFFTSIDEL